MAIEVGDRVRITKKSHQWYGKTGHIVTRSTFIKERWIVTLEDMFAPDCSVLDSEVRKIDDEGSHLPGVT